jgi:adenylate cyclase
MLAKTGEAAMADTTSTIAALPPSASGRGMICRGCWDQMRVPIPIRGPLAGPLRLFGVTQSKMNPNICTICERAFPRVKKRRQISVDATILFADIRGYTSLSEQMDTVEVRDLVTAFQDQCAHAVWAHDGIVNKQMGDGLMAIFNFPIKIERHAEAAVAAAIGIQRHCKAAFVAVAEAIGDPANALGVGVGVHSGLVEIGEFSTARSEFTAIGGVVNLAARLEAQAAAGEVLISSDCAAQAQPLTAKTPTRLLALKGIQRPVTAHVLSRVA